ncbi:uncharacterized protein TA15035 [Theileria annulata]|uniref:Uncharacterized protein n=1 Tax=Theileria annulata TaxID=5874 RepID=Q4UFU6_THEAN|nr:uncharacterized protein TA15035 [Theileria annulata]CAI74212.1 hypothetical protein TA15035 [Theileria annulata]|eukprot:XP_951944.1 hypothetical protein TA15035 [Theileria annulata]
MASYTSVSTATQNSASCTLNPTNGFNSMTGPSELVLYLCRNSFKYLYNTLIDNRFNEKILNQILNDEFIINNAVSRFLQFFTTNSTQLDNSNLNKADSNAEIGILIKNKILNELLISNEFGGSVSEVEKLDNILKVYKLTLFNRTNYVEFDRNLPLSYEKDKSLLIFDDPKLINEVKHVIRHEILSYLECLNFMFNYTLEHDCKVINNIVSNFEDFRSKLFGIYNESQHSSDLVRSALLLNLINLHYVSNVYTSNHIDLYQKRFEMVTNTSSNSENSASGISKSLQDVLLALYSFFDSTSGRNFDSSFKLTYEIESIESFKNRIHSVIFGIISDYSRRVNTNIVNVILLKVFEKECMKSPKNDLVNVIKSKLKRHISFGILSSREAGGYIPLYILRNDFFKRLLSDDMDLNIHIINNFILKNYPISLLSDLINTHFNSIQLGLKFNYCIEKGTLGDKGLIDIYNSVLLLFKNDRELDFITSTLSSAVSKSESIDKVTNLINFLTNMLILNKNFLRKLKPFTVELKFNISNVEFDSPELILLEILLKLYTNNSDVDLINWILRFFYARFLTIESLVLRICNTSQVDRDGQKLSQREVNFAFRKILYEIIIHMKLDNSNVEIYLVLLDSFYKLCSSLGKGKSKSNSGSNLDRIDQEVLTRMYRFILNSQNLSNLLTFITLVRTNCNELATDFIMLLINNRNYDNLVQTLRCNTLYNFDTNQLIVYNASSRSRKLLNSWKSTVQFDETIKNCPVEISLRLFDIVLEITSKDEKMLSFYVKNCFKSLLVSGTHSNRDLLDLFKSLKVLSINYPQAFNVLGLLYELSYRYNYNSSLLILSSDNFRNFSSTDNTLFINKNLSDNMESSNLELKGLNKDLMMYLLNLIVVADGDCDLTLYKLLKYLVYNTYFGFKYNIVNNEIIVSYDKIENVSEVPENINFSNIEELCNNILIKFINDQSRITVNKLKTLYNILSIMSSQQVVTEYINLILNKLINYCITSFEVTSDSGINSLLEDDFTKLMVKIAQLLVQKIYIFAMSYFDKVNLVGSVIQLGNFIVTTKSSDTFTSQLNKINLNPQFNKTNLNPQFNKDIENIMRKVLSLYFVLTTKGSETTEDTFTLFCLYNLVKIIKCSLVLNINEWRLLLLRLSINKYKDKLYLKYLFKLYNILKVSHNTSDNMEGHTNNFSGQNTRNNLEGQQEGRIFETCSVLEVDKLEKEVIDNYHSQELNTDMIIFLYNLSTKIGEEYLNKVIDKVIEHINKFSDIETMDNGEINQDDTSQDRVVLKNNFIMVREAKNLVKCENLKLFYIFYNEFERFGEKCFKEINRMVNEVIYYLTSDKTIKNSKYYIHFFKYLVRFKNHNQILKVINNIDQLNYYFYLIFLYSLANTGENNAFGCVKLMTNTERAKTSDLDILLKNVLCNRVKYIVNYTGESVVLYNELLLIMNLVMLCNDVESVGVVVEDLYNFILGKSSDKVIFLKIVNNFINLLFRFWFDIKTLKMQVVTLINVSSIWAGASGEVAKSMVDVTSGYCTNNMYNGHECNDHGNHLNTNNKVNGFIANGVETVRQVNNNKEGVEFPTHFPEIVRPESLGLNLYNVFFNWNEKIKLSNLDMFLHHFDAMYSENTDNQEQDKIKLLKIISEKLKILINNIVSNRLLHSQNFIMLYCHDDDDFFDKLDQLLGPESSVPLIQIVKLINVDINEILINYITNKKKFIYSYFDLSIYQFDNNEILLTYEWNEFKSRLVKYVEDKEIVKTLLSSDLVDFTRLLLDNVNFHVVYIFDNYNDIIQNKLLINILKLHEYVYDGINNVLNQLTNKLIVVLIGKYEIPINYQYNIPIIKLYYKYPSKSFLTNYIHQYYNKKISLGFIKYIVSILYSYYNNDIHSLLLYTSILYKIYNTIPNTTSVRNNKTLGIKLTSNQDLYNSIDKFIHNIIVNYKTRFISHITSGYPYSCTDSSINVTSNDTSQRSLDEKSDADDECYIVSNGISKSSLDHSQNGTNNTLSSDNLLKGNKSELNLLCKIILISSYISSIYNINVVSQYNKRYKQVTSVNSVSSNTTSHTFTLKYLMAILQLILILLDIKIKITNQFIHNNLFWLIEEGYIYIINSSNNNNIRIDKGKSGLIFNNIIKNEAEGSVNSNKDESNLILLNGNLKLYLNVSFTHFYTFQVSNEHIFQLFKEVNFDPKMLNL